MVKTVKRMLKFDPSRLIFLRKPSRIFHKNSTYPSLFQHKKSVYDLSQQALKHTTSIIRGSSNQLTLEELNTAEGMEIDASMTKMRNEPVPNEYSLAWIQKISQLAKKYKVGNCIENACLVFDFLHTESVKKKLFFNIEMFNNPFLDHFFIVIGREPGSEPTDPRKWNRDAIICDPWIESSCYTISEVDFANLTDNKWQVITYLLPYKGAPGPIILEKEILAKANGIDSSSTMMQPQMVLRARFNESKYEVFNTHIPVTYENWDLPKQITDSDSESDDVSPYYFRSFSRTYLP